MALSGRIGWNLGGTKGIESAILRTENAARGGGVGGRMERFSFCSGRVAGRLI